MFTLGQRIEIAAASNFATKASLDEE